MELGLNCRSEQGYMSHIHPFESTLLKGMNTRKTKKKMKLEDYLTAKERDVYHPIRLRNVFTGKPQAALNLSVEDLERKLEKMSVATNGPVRLLLVDEFPMEVKTDVRRAMRQFSKVQQKFLVEVLVRGLSIAEAAKLTRKNSKHWQRWLTSIALPSLRETLKDYSRDGRLILS